MTLAFVHSAWVSVFSAGFGNLLDIPYCYGSTIRSRATPYPFSEAPFEILLWRLIVVITLLPDSVTQNERRSSFSSIISNVNNAVPTEGLETSISL